MCLELAIEKFRQHNRDTVDFDVPEEYWEKAAKELGII